MFCFFMFFEIRHRTKSKENLCKNWLTYSNYRLPRRFSIQKHGARFFGHAEGFVANGSYVYQYKDQLGNVRMSYNNVSGTPTIINENHYYPYGLKHTGYGTNTSSTNAAHKYRYNSREWQDEEDLNLTAMDFRMYDNALGRFYGMDALSEKNHYLSPFQFADGNPIYYCDPSGLTALKNEAHYDSDIRTGNEEMTRTALIGNYGLDFFGGGGGGGAAAGNVGEATNEMLKKKVLGFYSVVRDYDFGSSILRCLVIGVMFEDYSTSEYLFPENEHGMVELPADDPNATNGQFTFDGIELYKYHNRNDVPFNGKAEKDQWGSAENLAKVIKVAIVYRAKFKGETISIGDISTETGNSPRYLTNGTRHKTHYDGKAFDFKYPTVGGATNSDKQANVQRTNVLLFLFKHVGFTNIIVGTTIINKVDYATGSNKYHNNHIHIH
jgi:RHS repeat-associated protein